MHIKVKIIDEPKNNFKLGTFHIETYDKNFIKELKKYVCPFRLVNFLAEKEGTEYTPLRALEKDTLYDMIFDFSTVTEEIIENKIAKGEFLSLLPEAYINSTKHLDKYGKTY